MGKRRLGTGRSANSIWTLSKNPEIETNEELLYTYFKTKFRNHIKDKIRQQESDKEKLIDFHILKLEKLAINFIKKKIYLRWTGCFKRVKTVLRKINSKEKEQYRKRTSKQKMSRKTKMKEIRELFKGF